MSRNGRALVVTASLGLIGGLPVQAASRIAPADLQAATNALGFLDSLQHKSVIVIGVVYAGGVTSNKGDATLVAEQLSVMTGPDSATIRANDIAVGELASAAQGFDVLYLMPGTASNSVIVADYVRQHGVLSISSDPACLDVQCCILMVHGGSSMDIVLETTLAEAAGVRFASVLTMMVKRR